VKLAIGVMKSTVSNLSLFSNTIPSGAYLFFTLMLMKNISPFVNPCPAATCIFPSPSIVNLSIVGVPLLSILGITLSIENAKPSLDPIIVGAF